MWSSVSKNYESIIRESQTARKVIFVLKQFWKYASATFDASDKSRIEEFELVQLRLKEVQTEDLIEDLDEWIRNVDKETKTHRFCFIIWCVLVVLALYFLAGYTYINKVI